ncbi:hypothetical protein BJ508DRAFT_325339 [Ascobolus immersus RN42]|uniref:Uncharacterized protein n=1 Tax=Ascobolus immersus RN42 TaxID=1160509 RepID=A0A3N4ID32_ASCIM|nr:hypothetical protein BJ508DRAFT_325339 [Ascobolus immersus RN42]
MAPFQSSSVTAKKARKNIPNFNSCTQFPHLPPAPPLVFAETNSKVVTSPGTAARKQAKIRFREQQELDRMFGQLKSMIQWTEKMEFDFRQAGVWHSEREFVLDQLRVLEECGFNRIPTL